MSRSNVRHFQLVLSSFGHFHFLQFRRLFSILWASIWAREYVLYTSVWLSLCSNINCRWSAKKMCLTNSINGSLWLCNRNSLHSITAMERERGGGEGPEEGECIDYGTQCIISNLCQYSICLTSSGIKPIPNFMFEFNGCKLFSVFDTFFSCWLALSLSLSLPV